MARRSTFVCAVLVGLSLPCAAAEVTLKAVTVFPRNHVFNAPVFEMFDAVKREVERLDVRDR